MVGYSEPIDTILDLDELQKHLHSLPSLPNAIPYITSYYSRNWGFCLSHEQRLALEDTKYHAVIDSELKDGVLNYSDLVIKGKDNAQSIVSFLIKFLMNDEKFLPSSWLEKINDDESKKRVIIDYICGMTDQFSINFYNNNV